MAKTKIHSFTLGLDQGARLAAVAVRKGMSRSRLVREWCEKLLSKYERQVTPDNEAPEDAVG